MATTLPGRPGVHQGVSLRASAVLSRAAGPAGARRRAAGPRRPPTGSRRFRTGTPAASSRSIASSSPAGIRRSDGGTGVACGGRRRRRGGDVLGRGRRLTVGTGRRRSRGCRGAGGRAPAAAAGAAAGLADVAPPDPLPSSPARQSANSPSSLLPTSTMTPAAELRGPPVIVQVGGHRDLGGAPAVVVQHRRDGRGRRPGPRASLALGLDDGAPSGLVLLGELGGPGVGHLDRTDLDLDPALDGLAVERLDGRAGHAGRDPLDVEQHVPRLPDRDRHRELVLELHLAQPPAAAVTARRVRTRARCSR